MHVEVVLEKFMDMDRPKPGRLRMSLHVSQYGDDKVSWDWWMSQALFPPMTESGIWSDKLLLLWTWSFSKGVAGVCASNHMAI